MSTLSESPGNEGEILKLIPSTCEKAKFVTIQQSQHPSPNSTLKMKIEEKLAWEISHVVWDPMFLQTVLVQRLETLTRLNVSQKDSIPIHKLQVTNEFLQQIIQLATNLLELSLNFCFFDNLSDFGITGISQEACQRMNTSGNYEIQNGDQTGSDLSQLPQLQILSLTDGLTQLVTDVTARFAFKGMPKLRSISLSKPQFTEDGQRALTEIFANNQLVCLQIISST